MPPEPDLNRSFSSRSAPGLDGGEPVRFRPSGGPPVRVLPLLLTFLLAAAPGHADEESHDRARRALQAGEVAPLGEVLAAVAQRRPGQVLEVELEQHGGRWIYEIELLHPDGVIEEIAVDAVTKQLLDDDAWRAEERD